MQTTGNLGLKKPDGTDIVDIADLNGNMDILDAAVQNVRDHAADAVKHVTAAERTAWNAKASTAAATASAAGLMAAADKAKLDGVAAGANKYVHPNHTGDVTSTGDGVTAIAPGVIVDADVNSAAAIGWSKISKTGSSLADLATRSAADLSSGTLAAARLPAATGDVTSPAGSNVFTFAPGVIVDADVSTSAQINAAKIGTAGITNTEFGYLDGATSNIQSQLNSKAPLTTTPQQTTTDISYYVRTDGNDGNTGLANTAGGAFKTINKAISMIPQVVNHIITIYIGNGSYSESILVGGFSGSGSITITGNQSDASLTSVTSVTLLKNFLTLVVDSLTANTSTSDGFTINRCVGFRLNSCRVISSSSTFSGVITYFSSGAISWGTYSNRGNGISVNTVSQIVIAGVSGTGNVIGLGVTDGSLVTRNELALTGTQKESNSGGSITGGILNPWGDNTDTTRSVGDLTRQSSGGQSIAASALSKIIFTSAPNNQKNTCDIPNSRFVAPETGYYLVNCRVGITGASTYNQLLLFVNSAVNAVLGETWENATSGLSISGSSILRLTAGSTVDFFVFVNAAAILSYKDESTHASIIRIA
ncbi:hypothetical protein [Paenibacillus sp. S150]|uniref:hypothetical protein n=1 Tax=Paenibacillus sp. S150 TaxID=2749826 RepID=UPI001C577886|nr:hypothetical protein [Paenibacillus sp. S150]MBW4083877.1 hypothetical protein [Paenibacillus sp. S150]